MKNFLLSIGIIFLCVTFGYAQKSILKVNLYTWIEHGDPEVYMEFNLNKYSSVDGALRLGLGSNPFSNRVEFNVDIRAGYRYYFLHKIFDAPIGLYIRPVVGFRSEEHTSEIGRASCSV